MKLATFSLDGRTSIGLVRDDVVHRPGDEAADGDHHRVEHVEPAGHHGLQRGDHLARGRDRVQAAPALEDRQQFGNYLARFTTDLERGRVDWFERKLRRERVQTAAAASRI